MKRLFRPLPILIASAVLLLALELGLRAVGFGAVRWYAPDPHLGWVLRPNVSGWYTGEGRAFVSVNSAGWRDREHSVAKPEGVYRIVVLGDAYAEAMQVALEDTYWAQLPQRLEGCGFQHGKRIEVLNFGVRDYGTGQAYLALERAALRYRPDLVLLQFDNGNDVRDNSHALDRLRGRPYFRLDGEGRLYLDATFTSQERYRRLASAPSRMFRAVADHSRALQFARSVPEMSLFARAYAKPSGNEAGLEVKALAAPADAQWEEAWRVSEALILKVRDLAARHGARTAVVTVPFALEVHPDVAWRSRVQAKYGVSDLAYPDRRVVAFARQHGMLGVLLSEEMKALATASGKHLYGYENRELGFGHWNELGHRSAADITARALCASPAG
jgi:hypothetical protein